MKSDGPFDLVQNMHLIIQLFADTRNTTVKRLAALKTFPTCIEVYCYDFKFFFFQKGPHNFRIIVVRTRRKISQMLATTKQHITFIIKCTCRRI